MKKSDVLSTSVLLGLLVVAVVTSVVFENNKKKALDAAPPAISAEALKAREEFCREEVSALQIRIGEEALRMKEGKAGRLFGAMWMINGHLLHLRQMTNDGKIEPELFNELQKKLIATLTNVGKTVRLDEELIKRHKADNSMMYEDLKEYLE
jgi:hypothetical protein